MERFVKYETHDYMDEFPDECVRTFLGETEKEIETNAKAWCKHMNENYSGGTTKFIKVMSAKEARAYLDAEITKIKKPDSADKEWVKDVNALYNKCYTE